MAGGNIAIGIVVAPDGHPADVCSAGFDEIAPCMLAAARTLDYGPVSGGGTASITGSFSLIAVRDADAGAAR